jgi:phosphate butyryltransferase
MCKNKLNFTFCPFNKKTLQCIIFTQALNNTWEAPRTSGEKWRHRMTDSSVSQDKLNITDTDEAIIRGAVEDALKDMGIRPKKSTQDGGLKMEQIRTLDKLVDYAKSVGPKRLSVACAEDSIVMDAVEKARKEGIIKGILVGNADKIREVIQKMGIDASNYEIVDEKCGPAKAALKAVEVVSSGKADILMKGMLETADFLRGVLNKEVGLTVGNKVLSHAYIHEIKGYDRLFFVTDGVFNVYPELKEKIAIVNNVTLLCHSFGIECPKIACLAAVEVVNPKMPPTLDAAALTMMNRRGQIKGCVVDGPLALDNAVSPESAKHKGIKSDVAGHADVLMVPAIEAGNILLKSIVYFSENKTAAIVLGAKAPVVLSSRADSAETKYLSIATAVAVAAFKK